VISQAQLKALLSYDPDTGIFRWKTCAYNKTHLIGTVAGTLLLGYVVIRIGGRGYKAHRLAWLYTHGEIPDELDHINCVRDDNRLVNLRPADRAPNSQNTRKRANKTSQYKGVSLRRATGKWKVGIDVNGRRIYLGYYDTQETAHAVYCDAARKYHGEFARFA
jgi:hypothetical protein